METDAIARVWREQCVSTATWLESKNQSGAVAGIADGVYMESEEFGWRRTYVKPREPGAMSGRAAREKIASDLAFDLGVPVPPVILVDRHDAGSTRARRVAASLVMYPKQQPWSAVRKALGKTGRSSLRDKARETLGRDAALGIALDTWVEQPDHHPEHPHNIVFGWNDHGSGFIFLDYEYAFGGFDQSWRGERSADCCIAPFPQELLDAADIGTMKCLVDRIEQLNRRDIEDIVNRIPAEFLDEGNKAEIVGGLVARQALVRRVLRARFAWEGGVVNTLTYSCAIVSFCADLTSGDAASLPVGVLLVGRLEDYGIASVLVPSLVGHRLDEITHEVLMSVPDLLRQHVVDVLDEDRGMPAAEILRRLHEQMRNSLFVSAISTEVEVEVAKPLETVLGPLLVGAYETALTDHGWKFQCAEPAGAVDAAAIAHMDDRRVDIRPIPDAATTFGFGRRDPGAAAVAGQ